jgi:hypothetical protein
MPRFAATYFNPKTGWQVNGAAVYSVNWENPATHYETGDILNLEGAITKNFGALGVGAVAYAMIQTTPDSGAGARLGAFESKVYGAGPIVTYSMGGLTLLAVYGVRRREHLRRQHRGRRGELQILKPEPLNISSRR